MRKTFKIAGVAVACAGLMMMPLAGCSQPGDGASKDGGSSSAAVQKQNQEVNVADYVYETPDRGMMPKLSSVVDLDGEQLLEVFAACDYEPFGNGAGKQFLQSGGGYSTVNVNIQNLSSLLGKGTLMTDMTDDRFKSLPKLGDAKDAIEYQVDIPTLTLDQIRNEQGLDFEWFASYDNVPGEPIFAGMIHDKDGELLTAKARELL